MSHCAIRREQCDMVTTAKLTDAYVGKYTLVSACGMSIPVKIASVGDGMLVFMVLDSAIPLRSGKLRFNPDKEIDIYDTMEEVMDWEKGDGL